MEKNAGRGAVRHVDSYDLVRSGARISGSVPLLALSRFLAGLPEQADTLVDWSVVGEKNASGQAFLTVRVAARPLLECQRCLEPFEWPIDASVRLQVVAESALDADSHEPDAEQDMIERIAGSHRLDVLALIEDELVLSLPYVPKHDVCPSLSEPREEGPDSVEKRPSPFSVLGKLKN